MARGAEPKVLHEDAEMLVLCKPAGLLTHPISSLAFETDPKLAEALGVFEKPSVLAWILERIPGNRDLPRGGLVHRLDAGTSGVMLAAKTANTAAALSEMFARRQIKKTYVALAQGRFPAQNGVIDLKLLKRYGSRRVRVMASKERGVEAVTVYRVLRQYSGPHGAQGEPYLLVELRPLTGRTHQLRTHLAALKVWICGDTLYGKPGGAAFGRLMLHARRIELRHPVTGRPLRITAIVPADFSREFQKHTGSPFPKGT